MGGAADLARHMRHQASLSNAVDAASIALGRSIKDYPECDTIGATCPNAKTFVLNYITPMVTSDNHFTITASGITVTRVANGFAVTADGVMDTMFLPVGNLVTEGQGIGSMNVHVSSEVVSASNRLELALVLDNTGSMNCASTVTYDCAEKWKTPETNSKIGALKSASKTLVDTLMADSVTNPDLIKIALVPFEGP
jgi:hypothetical protein